MEAGFAGSNFAFMVDVDPDMLQIVNMLDVVIPINRIFNDRADAGGIELDDAIE